MNFDDIQRMAQEAAKASDTQPPEPTSKEMTFLIEFAFLVAAASREERGQA